MTRPELPARQPRAKGAPTALDGLLVVDFTRVVAGPACTQTLADFGAEVIKIENPEGGDDTRHYEHAEIGGESAAYLTLNPKARQQWELERRFQRFEETQEAAAQPLAKGRHGVRR